MKYLSLFYFALVLIASCKKEKLETNALDSFANDDNKIPGYKLVWSDEFDYTGLPDSTKWGYEKGHVRNDETQYYEQARLKNSQVKNGNLIIAARNDNFHGAEVTSASIITKGKMDFLYGKIVVKAKMPEGLGCWPAIWTEGINRDTVHWPLCGETDILEWVGRAPQYVNGSMYMPNGMGGDTSRVTSYDVGDSTILSAKYHTYSIEWDSTQIKYFYDGYNYATYKAADISAEEWQPFTKPHYLILNLAMGDTGGGPIDVTKYPFIYKIDYVRYYQKQ
jgi:beta-glucanase (GH16 family)